MPEKGCGGDNRSACIMRFWGRSGFSRDPLGGQAKTVEFFSAPEVGDLKDGDLELVLRSEIPGDPARNWAPGMSFDMRLASSGEHVGAISLRLGTSDELVLHAGQVGYQVAKEHRGRRFAARAVTLLIPVARTAGMTELWITCDPDNFASRRTIEIAGGLLLEIREIAECSSMRSSGRTQVCRYRFELVKE